MTKHNRIDWRRVMRAVEYFEQVRSMEREFNRRCWMVASAEEKLDMIKSALGCGRGGGDPSWRVAEVVERWESYVGMLRLSVDALIDCEHEAYENIRALKDAHNGDNMRDVLQLRYIRLLEDAEICSRMGCSPRTMRRWFEAAFDWYDTLRFFERKPPRWL